MNTHSRLHAFSIAVFGCLLLTVGCFGQTHKGTATRELPKREPFVYDAAGWPKCQDAECRYWKAKALEAEANAKGTCWTDMHGFLSDITVTKTVTHQPMTITEIMDVLSHSPEVADVMMLSSHYEPLPLDNVEMLAYPQYGYHFMLTNSQWNKLRFYCRLRLDESGESGANREVTAHWKSIVAGKPPFGLQVADDRE